VKEIVFVRHGESVGNVALDQENCTGIPPVGHHSTWPLTETGLVQARQARDWLHTDFPGFDLYVSSPYMRARQTAGVLYPDERWQIDYRLREREWGGLETATRLERRRVRWEGAAHHGPEIDFFWRAPQGESLADVLQRVQAVVHELREVDGTRALVVCHGAVLWMARMALEQIRPRRFFELSHDPDIAIGNCDVLHYLFDPLQLRVVSPCLGSVSRWAQVKPAFPLGRDLADSD
jgi:broad specificity phosphatase PhoE